MFYITALGVVSECDTPAFKLAFLSGPGLMHFTGRKRASARPDQPSEPLKQLQVYDAMHR